MKTLFISSFQPIISRNILASGVLEILRKENNLRIVLLVPDYKRDHFERLFGGGNVLVEGAPLYGASKRWLGLFFKKSGIFLFDTKAARQRKQYDFYINRRFFRYIASMCLGFIGHSQLILWIMRWCDQKFSPKGFYTRFLDKYSPDVIFATDVQNENDVSLCQDARDSGIPIISMVRSWDNLTLRILRFIPDILLVGSTEVRKEAIELHHLPPEKVIVVGNPHYSKYRNGSTKSRQEFFASYKLSDDRPLILYAPVTDVLIRLNDIDEYILSILASLNINVIVRFPPEKPVTLGKFTPPSHMVYDRTGFVFKKDTFGDRELRPEDEDNLINSLYYADLVITGPTSIAIDSALVDKPVIVVNLYPKEKPFWETVWRYKDNHIQKLISTGGVWYVDSKEEFLRAIKEYLKNSKLHAEGRAIIREKWFSHSDSRSAPLLAKTILDFMNFR